MSGNASDSGSYRGSVIVVGAGMAGLAAADYLARHSFQVTVLEARDRIGGRVCTDDSWTPPIDLGASWIHGTSNNPIAQLARAYSVRTTKTEYDSLPVVYSVSQGRRRRLRHKKVKIMTERVQELEDACASRHASPTNGPLGDCLREAMTPSERHNWLLMHFIHSAIEQEYATEVDTLSQRYWDEAVDFEGDTEILPEGYRQIALRLAQGLQIKAGCEVTHVSYGSDGVSVTSSKEKFRADRAIITVPLGVLKNEDIKFDPPLPVRKQDAINKLDMATLNKLFLLFPERFWPKDYDWIEHASPDIYDWPLFFNFFRYSDVPILVGLTIGRQARNQEEHSNEELAKSAMKVLRTIFRRSIPDPDKILFTRWTRDRFARGSYCYVPPTATGEDLDVMAESVDDRLFFAGEATRRLDYGTTHGAFLSGIRAGRMISKI